MKTVYVDNNATTPIAEEVFNVMVPFLTTEFYNPSSMYEKAKFASQAIDNARQSIADFFGGVSPSEILFTSCGTESNNTALRGVAKTNQHKKHIITTQVEHPAILEVCKAMVREGYEVTFLPVDSSGQLNIIDYVKALRKDTLLVSIMHANNETGVVYPVAELARIAKETNPKIIFHTDATQTVGKIPINLMREYRNVDLLTFSAHKLHAPKGVGALFVRKGTPVATYLIGGHQEKGRRAGTENVAGIVAMGKAVELASKGFSEEQKIQDLRDYLEKELVSRIPYVQVNGAGAPRLPNTLNLAFHYIEGESILYELDSAGICASSGSACTSGSLEPSHVLLAMKVPHTAAHGSIRFSLSRYNTKEEMDHIINVLPSSIKALRRISPYWDDELEAPRKETLPF